MRGPFWLDRFEDKLSAEMGVGRWNVGTRRWRWRRRRRVAGAADGVAGVCACVRVCARAMCACACACVRPSVVRVSQWASLPARASKATTRTTESGTTGCRPRPGGV